MYYSSLIALFAVWCWAPVYALPQIFNRRSDGLQQNVCTTNISLPTVSPCTSICEPVQKVQMDCQDLTLCMCKRTPPQAIRDCMDCVFKSAGDFVRLVPQVVSETQERLDKYQSACDALPTTNTSMHDDTPRTVSSVTLGEDMQHCARMLPISRLVYLSPFRQSHLPLWSILFLSFLAAVLLLSILRPCLFRKAL